MAESVFENWWIRPQCEREFDQVLGNSPPGAAVFPTGAADRFVVCLRRYFSVSRHHVERNRRNRCPEAEPVQTNTATFSDHLGGPWKQDSPVTSAFFHGRLFGYVTYRGCGTGQNGRFGSQCTYYDGHLVDYGLIMGTYDYSSPELSIARHVLVDVQPGFPVLGNESYVENITETY